jgi:hypothetical protein
MGAMYSEVCCCVGKISKILMMEEAYRISIVVIGYMEKAR